MTCLLSICLSNVQSAEDCPALKIRQGDLVTQTRMDLSRLYLTNGIIKREIYSVSWIANFISKCSDLILWPLNLKC